VTIAGSTFGNSPTGNTVTFNGTTASPSNWSSTSINVPVPSGASSGPVVVTVGGNGSAGVGFTVVTTGTLSGTITRATGGSAVSGATVQAVLAGVVKGTATSAANGTYTITNLDQGTYDVRVSATGFAPELRQSVTVPANVATTLNVALLQPGSISGVVTQPNGTSPIVGASVALYQNAVQKSVVATDGSGAYSVTSLHPGAYTLQVSSVGYSTQEVGVTISENSNTTRNVSLQNAPAGQVTYVYDEIGRLVSVVDPAGNAATYRYDAVGNLTAIDRPGSAAVSVSEFTPNAGPVGTTVLIYGTGFSTTPSSNTVTINGAGATVTAATANQLTVAVPAGATTGPIGVTSPGGSATTSTSFTVTAASAGPPTITSFTPQIWNGTSALTITGTNFDTTVINDRASVNGMASSVLTATTTSLNVQLPSVTPSGHVSVSTLAGAATSTNDFFAPPPGYSSTNIQSTSRMTVGGSQTLSFPVAGKYSLIVFDGTPGHHVAATLSGVTLGSGTTELYDPSAHRTASNTIFIFYTGYVETTIAGTASYTMLVGSTGSSTGDVTVTLWDSVDLSGSITADGSPVTVSITAPAQNEYLTFSGVAGQRISLTAQNGFNPTVNCDLNVSILKPNRTTLVGPTCMEAGGVIDTTVLPVTGTYTLLVDPFEAATGNVTLRLFTVPADISGPITPGGPAVPVTTTTPGQNASLTFNGATGDRMSLLAASPSLTNTTFGCDLNVTILKPDGNPLGGATCMESGGFIDVTTLPATGVYTISIDMVAAAYGSLTFTLYSVPADVSGTITIGGAAVPMTISTPGQNGSLTFAANANQQISLQSTTTSGFNAPFSCDVDVRILKPDTTPLVNTTCMDGNASIGQTTIPTTGTYTIVVDPESASTGSITFTLVSAP
jgi:YD repeat-containing protein